MLGANSLGIVIALTAKRILHLYQIEYVRVVVHCKPRVCFAIHVNKSDPLIRLPGLGGCILAPCARAVHQLKYRRDLALGERLAELIVQVLDKQDWEVDLIVPVPLGKKRLRQRGYNQAVMLARPLAWTIGVEYGAKILKRVRETKTQIGLSRLERRENVSGAFEANTQLLKGRKVLLVDDVITTGATLNSAAFAMRQVGVEQVYAVTLARAASLSRT